MYGQKFSLGIDPEHHGPLPTHSLNGQTEWITAGNGETTIALPWMNTFVIISTPDAALTAQLAAAVTVPSPIRTLTVADDVRAMSVQAFTQRSATSTYTTTSQPSAIARIVRDLRGASQPLTPDSDCTSDDPVMTTVTLTLTSGRAGSRTYLVALAPCGRVTDGAGAALSVTSALRADVIDLLPDAGLTPAH